MMQNLLTLVCVCVLFFAIRLSYKAAGALTIRNIMVALKNNPKELLMLATYAHKVERSEVILGSMRARLCANIVSDLVNF